MIEAVNSLVSNAPFLRANAEQVSAVRLELPESVSAGPQAPYVSPYISVDVNFDTAVLQIRNSSTGDVIRQFPSESTLEARRRATVAKGNAVLQAQESGSEIGVNKPHQQTRSAEAEVPSVEPTQTATAGNAEAQVAAQALNAGAQTGQASSSGNVSVVA
ncbi:MAG TPA: hypothetical protein DEA55_11390 [Rhodospirillaceae bacterium]|nr:hypothetical protein [Rhodospirillaceae bacterium]